MIVKNDFTSQVLPESQENVSPIQLGHQVTEQNRDSPFIQPLSHQINFEKKSFESAPPPLSERTVSQKKTSIFFDKIKNLLSEFFNWVKTKVGEEILSSIFSQHELTHQA